MINTAIFASGTGSNAKKLLERESKLSSIQISLILTDHANAGVIDIAKSYKKEVVIIEKNNLSKKDHEKKILYYLNKNHIEWIFLAGYMKILSPQFIKIFYCPKINQSKIINIHPSLLPKFKGLKAYEQAYHSQDKTSGVTVHFVDPGVDTGKTIKQIAFTREENESLESFKIKGLQIEHEIYPEVLEMLDRAITKNSYKDFL